MNKNKLFFYELFKRYENNQKLQDKSMMYRDILKYGVLKSNFRARELTGWLLENNEELAWKIDSLADGVYGYVIAKHIKRIKKYLETLTEKELTVSKKVKQTFGSGLTNEYMLSDFGYFVHLLLEYDTIKEESRNSDVEKLYDFMQEHFRKEPYSTIDVFAAEFFKKLKDNKLFEMYVKAFLRNLEVVPDIENYNDFSMQILFIPLYNNELTKKIYKLWKDSLAIFENDEEKDIFLYGMKLHIQKIVELQISNKSKRL
ncbi:MAG: hypothetical protein ACPKPY_08855 [Nitrososphaeraceae archaeon]